MRLGNGGAKEVIKHEFFEGIDWKKMLKKQSIVPFIPVVAHKYDLSNFDDVEIMILIFRLSQTKSSRIHQ